MSCNSKTLLPKRLPANVSNSSFLRGGGSFEINSFAASIRNFGFDVRAGAPRRNHANSFLIRFCRRDSVATAWRNLSALAKT